MGLTINGTARSFRAGTLELVEGINGRATFRVGIYSANGSYVPDVGQTVVWSQGSDAFTGSIVHVEERWVAMGSGVESTITAEDYSGLAERVLVTASTSGGITGRDAIDYLVDTYLGPAFGVTRDPSMPTGATLGALSYDYAPCNEVLNDIVKLAASDGWLWRIDASKVLKAFLPGSGTYACPFSITAGTQLVGDVTVSPTRTLTQGYANRVYLVYNDGTATPAVATANDSAAQTARGLYEAVIRSDAVLDASTASAIATAELTRRVYAPKTLTFSTLTTGARAGQTISVSLSARGLSGDFLIQEVKTRDLDGGHFLHEITAVQGGKMTTTWKDTYKTWAGSGGSAIASVGGTVTITVGRVVYPLGGSATAGVRSAGPSVTNAHGYLDVQVDGTALAGASVTAVVQARALSAGVTVTPQVYNVTTSAVAGTGTAVTGTSWGTVTFAVTLAAGMNTYRLRLTPGTANVDVFGLGYLEVGR